jgi:ABC-type phosphate transport system substrate-binding protein
MLGLVMLAHMAFSSNVAYLHEQEPTGASAVLVAEFLRFVLSKDGQMVVGKDGYYSLSETLGDRQLIFGVK